MLALIKIEKVRWSENTGLIEAGTIAVSWSGKSKNLYTQNEDGWTSWIN